MTRGVTYYFEVSAFPFTSSGSLQFSVTGVFDAPGPCTSSATGSIPGGMTVSSGTECLSNASVNGPLTVRSGAELVLTNTTVRGPVTSDGATGLQLCGNSITGPVVVTNSKGLVVIGDAGNSECAGNTIDGNVLVGGSSASANRSGIQLGTNTITGQVQVLDNRVNPASVLVPQDASIAISDNQIRGTLSCTGNAPPPVDDAFGNTVSGPLLGQCAAL